MRINEDDLEMAGIDGGGTPVWHYKGKPFTGTLFCNEDDGSLSYEQECQEGFEEGLYQSYYPNGNTREKYQIHNNRVVSNTHQEWDEDGKLLASW